MIQIRYFGVILAIVIFLFGCVTPPPFEDNHSIANNSFIPTVNTTDISVAHNNLGFNLFHKLTQPGKNLFISPSSISFALGMVHSGAAGQTEIDMAKVLSIQTIDQPDLANFNLIKALGEDKSVELSIADSIWLDDGFSIKPDYQKNMEKYYLARISNVDFSNPQSATTVNGWVSDNTRGKITKIIDPPLDGVEAILINAVYFKGKWTSPFNASLTTNRTFTFSDGQTKQIAMMQKKSSFDYLENDQFQAVRLPYGNQSLAMYVFLPKQPLIGSQKIEDFVQNMDSAKWNDWLGSFSHESGTVILPKFKMEYSTELDEQLKQLGMASAFSDNADFSNMAIEPVKISRVIHKTYIETNEEGSEAAAVTAVVMVATSAPGPYTPPKEFYMDVNRPFFFAIQDDKTGEILFMGVVNDPTAS
ncbi:Serpin (serine protease inhibitor) [Candidatus Bilamarchaeum dharawalense]|uniref:Serpin (Serine protease inhibitor) n=1 Tax=Candidatus Bilamarchaeum dharawalense TaxID=2885759 RepID=A0A5E4LNQ2_9ARCH|nr:Serpin (serine protease inhibitor) [Candidatus Bilamarchaeum dharawalense]